LETPDSKAKNLVISDRLRYNLIFTGLAILILLFFLLDLFLGSVSLKPKDVIDAIFNNTENIARTILVKFRLPKAITALSVGIALSISGLQMQTLFRNPMAGPYVLGISSGASLGVALVLLGFSSSMTPESIKAFGNWAIAGASWGGAGLVMILIMFISGRVKNILTVLILGIMLSSGIAAIVGILQYFSSETMLKAYIIWTMGSLGNLTSSQLNVLLVSVLFGVLISLISVKMLNAMLLGENYAKSIGLNVRMSRIIIITGTSILAGTITAFCGPIGFIGIAVPHVARIIFRTSDHKVLIPGTLLVGGIIMLISDIVSQMPGSDNILPVNSITALIGIPVVIWVILRNQRYSEIF
jgi:iron complex transport system permease protein